jgi:dephospho-CoA kinase
MKHTIIGIAGTFASGKDTLSDYLVKEYNYLHISTGDMVRQEALKRRGSIERPVLHEVGDALRREHGGGVLVDLAIKTFDAKHDKYVGVVISGLRSVGEIKSLKKAGGMLVFVDAPIQIRHARMISRKRDAESQLTLDEFKAQEAKELEASGQGDEAFNILAIRDMADVVLTNDNDLETFLARARQAIGL